MWGLFVGLPLGFLQIFMITKISSLVTGGGKSKYTVWFILGDIILLMGVFTGVALISAGSLLWTATGMAGFMIIASFIIFIRKMKTGR